MDSFDLTLLILLLVGILCVAIGVARVIYWYHQERMR